MFGDLLYRLRALFRRASLEAELEEELRGHIEQQIEKHLQSGLSLEEAERRARLEFGNVGAIKEECREAWGIRLINELFQDVRFGLRQLRRNPGFAAVVIMTLALGIGGNTAVFSVVNAVLLRPLPFKNPGRLVQIRGVVPLKFTTGSGLEWRSWAKGTKTLEDISVYATGDVNWAGGGRPMRASAAEVSGAFFQMLGTQPIEGRTFAASDEAASQPSVVILSYSLWKTRWPSGGSAIGETIQINGRPFTVIGVMPRGFNFPNRRQLWFPFALALPGPIFGDNVFIPATLARLRPGFSIHQVVAEMEVTAKRDATGDKSGYPPQIQVLPLHRALVGNTRQALLLLFGAVGLVLLIACADAANLLLSRNAGRVREVAVRSALGASRWRLIRQLLAESILLSLTGGAVGLLLGWCATKFVRALIPSTVPLTSGIGMDRWVLGFTFAVAVGTGIFAGLLPVLRSTRVNLTETLKEGGPDAHASSGGGTVRLRTAFGVAEIALAFVLLAGAALTIRSFADLIRVKPGFRTDHLISTRVALLGPAYKTQSSKTQFYDRVLRRAQALPGVRGAAFVSALPLAQRSWALIGLDVEGHPHTSKLDEKHLTPTIYATITPGYFRVMGIALLKGRYFNAYDAERSTPVAVISQSVARSYWGKGNPLGKRFRFAGTGNQWFKVVGVVTDVRGIGLSIAPKPRVYFPMVQRPAQAAFLVVRTAGAPMAVAGSLTDIVRSVDPEEPVSSYETMQQILSQSVASPKFRSVLLGAFAVLALLLAMAGVYGIMSYSVSQRQHEIGIRMALGAKKSDVLKMVVGQGLKLALIGVAIGIAGALALTRFLSSLLYGVKPTDPLTFIAVSLILLAVALVACYIPARRAAKVDPMVALRYE